MKKPCARLAPFLGVGLELLLERRELGKGRIRIRRLVATLPAFAAALEVLGPQLGVALGVIAAASGPLRTAVALGTAATIGTVLIGTFLMGGILIGTILIGPILIGTSLTMPARLAVLPRLRRIRDLAGARHGLAGGG